MGAALQVGDVVRVVPGTASAELLEEWSDLTGEVRATTDDGATVWVIYHGPLPGFASALPARHFARDVPLDAAPF